MTDIATLLIAASLGAMVYFSAFIAPMVFRVLPEDHAGRFLRALFPTYFLVSGLVALAAAGLMFAAGHAGLGGILIFCGLAMTTVWAFAIPRINAARDAALAGDAAAQATFDKLHRMTVIVNVIEMVALVGVIIAAT